MQSGAFILHTNSNFTHEFKTLIRMFNASANTKLQCLE